MYCILELNYNNRVFVRNTLSYANGFTYTIDDNDVSALTYSEFVTWIQRYMQEEFKKLYYCEPEKTLVEGIHHIANDVEYATFIFDAYGTDGKIFVYVDHAGVEIEEWFGDNLDKDDNCDSCIMGRDNEDKLDNLMNVSVDSTSEYVVIKRTSNDDLLSKLCVLDEEDNLHNTLGDEG
ncbi:unnamed protein product [Lactuca saligna]|uniref:PB1-like domain-containing protein n=1 Tax=Lactuca saligna TaxID=75948 RepID=A0AA36E537_LACSI|nr:unnamed protein product [Lactuca saligna]